MLNPLKVELRSLNISGDKSAAIMIHVWFVIQNFFGNGIKSNRNEAVSGLFHVGRCVCVTILSDLIRAVKFVRLFASEPESVAVFIKPKDFRTDSSKKKVSDWAQTSAAVARKIRSSLLSVSWVSWVSSVGFVNWYQFTFYFFFIIPRFWFSRFVSSRLFAADSLSGEEGGQ